MKRIFALSLVLMTVFTVGIFALTNQPAGASQQSQDVDCSAEPHLILSAEAAKTTAVYAADALDSKSLGQFEAGEVITVVGRNRDGDWLVVEWDGSIVGWVQLETVKILECSNRAENTGAADPTPFPPTALPPSS